MSQENVEIVKAALEAANRDDWEGVFKNMTPDFELDFSRAVGPILHGVLSLEQVRRGLMEFAGTWQSARIEPHEFIEADDLVVVPYSLHLRGRDGVEVVSRPTTVWTVRDGTIRRVVMYQERQDALEAAGLSE